MKTAALIAALAVMGVASVKAVPTYHLDEGPGGLVTDIPGAVVHQTDDDRWLVSLPAGEEWLTGPSIRRLPEADPNKVIHIQLPWPDTGDPLAWVAGLVRGVGDFEDGVTSFSVPIGFIDGDNEAIAYVTLSTWYPNPSGVPEDGSTWILWGMGLSGLGCAIGAIRVVRPKL